MNNVVEKFNVTWTDTLERRPSIYNVLDSFRRKDSVAKQDLREECLAVGVHEQ